jgi:hypothetical protein
MSLAVPDLFSVRGKVRGPRTHTHTHTHTRACMHGRSRLTQQRRRTTGQVALVTGGTRGVGLSMPAALAPLCTCTCVLL